MRFMGVAVQLFCFMDGLALGGFGRKQWPILAAHIELMR